MRRRIFDAGARFEQDLPLSGQQELMTFCTRPLRPDVPGLKRSSSGVSAARGASPIARVEVVEEAVAGGITPLVAAAVVVLIAVVGIMVLDRIVTKQTTSRAADFTYASRNCRWKGKPTGQFSAGRDPLPDR
jgi:hypothetical protein